MKKSSPFQKNKFLKKKNDKNILPAKPHVPVGGIYVNVQIKNKTFRIFCDDGKQKVKWLREVAIHLFDNHYALNCGMCGEKVYKKIIR